MELGAWPFASEDCELGASSLAAWVVWISKGSRRVGLVVGVPRPEELEVAIFEAGRGRSCWNFRCDLVGDLRIHPAPHSSGASGFRGFRVFDLPPTFSFLRSSYLLDSFNPIYYMPHMTSYSNRSAAVVSTKAAVFALIRKSQI